MNESICKFCSKECRNNISKAAHERFCKLNPNYEQNMKVHREKTMLKGIVAGKKAQHEYAKNDPLNQIKEYILICPVCGKQFSENIKVRDYNHGNYKKTCSIKCAHSRPMTDERRENIKASLIESAELSGTCKVCGKKFFRKNSKKSLDICSRCDKTDEHSFNVSLHVTKCFSCGKEIWCKTDYPEILCYECANKKGIPGWQLFDENGKRLNNPIVVKKLKEKIANGTWNGAWKTRPIASYPETFWKKVLENNDIQYDFNYYVSKKSLGVNLNAGYFLDFLIGDKIDLEIDGKQHKYPDRVEKDIERDKLLKSAGYIVYRIEWNEINTETGKELMKKKIDEFMNFFRKNQLSGIKK